MKFLSFVIAFAAVLLAVQAYNLDLVLFVTHENDEDINGKLIVNLRGKKASQQIVFEEEPFSSYTQLNADIDFPEKEIEQIDLLWTANDYSSELDEELSLEIETLNIINEKDSTFHSYEMGDEVPELHHGVPITLLKGEIAELDE